MSMRISSLSVAFLLTLSVVFSSAIAGSGSDVEIKRVLEVGSIEEVHFTRGLYQEYPDSAPQLDEYRKEIADLSYGTKVNFHFVVKNSSSEINWGEVVAGAGVGLGLALAWNAFGGELLCFLGVAPMCACVGPQC